MPVAPPIDFDLIRAGIARTLQQTLELDQNSVVMAEAEAPVAKRPELPFVDFSITSVSQAFARDAMRVSDVDPDYWIYSGTRQLTVMFRFYGATHEQAYGLASAWQSSLSHEPTTDALSSYGLAVWHRDPVVNISSLLSTGFEGRAAVNATFGLASSMAVKVGYIEQVPVSGVVHAGGDEVPVNIIAELKD